MSKAGDALLNGDYAAAKELTTTLWQIDGDVPSEALPLVEITSAEPCIVTMGEVPPELDYWLQHPDQRLRHSMALGAEENGNIRAVWKGPDTSELYPELVGYVRELATDRAGQTDWDQVNEAAVSIYKGDFSKVPGVTQVEWRGAQEAVFTFDGTNDTVKEQLANLNDRLNQEKSTWGEVGFTFSVQTDDDGRPVRLEDIRVVAHTFLGRLEFPDSVQSTDALGHTHPMAHPFSGGDMAMIVKHPDVYHMVIIGNNKAYIYKPGKGIMLVELKKADQ